MNSEEEKLRASERFDEAGAAPENPAELETWEDFALIANHLETVDVVVLPTDFAQQLQREIRDIQRRRDLVLVLQTAFVTSLILTFVAATALGFDWWERLLAAVRPNNLAAYWTPFAGLLSSPDLDARGIYVLVAPFARLLPGAFLAATIAALLLEIAIFRLLRIGPFQMKTANSDTPHTSYP
ncbi:MAG: hypothetical protein EOP84_32285 [Verrucomicrobiaceae bacterium]|nr:MAG: hypothetical protein EOP84_32285 [Verrucomicrobiaceae bacterium]